MENDFQKCVGTLIGVKIFNVGIVSLSVSQRFFMWISVLE